jgi:hypothetical protein
MDGNRIPAVVSLWSTRRVLGKHPLSSILEMLQFSQDRVRIEFRQSVA